MDPGIKGRRAIANSVVMPARIMLFFGYLGAQTTFT
jgi:hypothetical protein